MGSCNNMPAPKSMVDHQFGVPSDSCDHLKQFLKSTYIYLIILLAPTSGKNSKIHIA